MAQGTLITFPLETKLQSESVVFSWVGLFARLKTNHDQHVICINLMHLEILKTNFKGISKQLVGRIDT